MLPHEYYQQRFLHWLGLFISVKSSTGTIDAFSVVALVYESDASESSEHFLSFVRVRKAAVPCWLEPGPI
jgi:hypothetical protein